MNYLAETNQKFVDAIKTVENNIAIAKRRGEYKQVKSGEWRWFPGKSPEGGLPTLAWGHKLTSAEWEKKRIEFLNRTTGVTDSADFRFGLNDEQVNFVLMDDLIKAENKAKYDWDMYHKDRPWDELKPAYKGVMINLTFNTGSLAKKGKWVWNTVASGVIKNDDKLIVIGMITSYKRPDGKRIRLTSRAKEIAKGLNLPWQVIKE